MHRETAIEIGKFGIAGGSVAVLHLLLVYFLTSTVGLWYLASSTVSYIGAIILNFYLQKYFVRKNFDTERLSTQFSAFTTLSLIVLGLNTACMYILVSTYGVQYLIAQAVVIAALSVGTFIINRHFIFRT